MNKKEKKLAKKILTSFESGLKRETDFTDEESKVLERWRSHRIINQDAFLDVTSAGSNNKKFLQNLNYPFTYFGDQEISKNWYLDFRNSKLIIIIRDFFTVTAFFVSLTLAIFKFFPR